MTTATGNWAVVTGSTGGLGSEIVKILAARDQNLVLLNRSKAKSLAQREQLLAAHHSLHVEIVTADLMDIEQTSVAVETINALPGRVDLLINNSGILTSEKTLSKQGYESQFAVNVLAAYQLTLGLMEKMTRASGETPGMAVMLSSSAVNAQKKLQVDTLSNPTTVGGLMGTYAHTKLAVTALAPVLAEPLKAANVLIRAIDPGATKTAMTTGGNAAMPKLLQWFAPLLFKPADKQALKLIEAADPSAFGGVTGAFVANGKLKKMPAAALDKQAQTALMSLLEGALASKA